MVPKTAKWFSMKLRIYKHVRAGATQAKLGGAVTTWVVGIGEHVTCHMFRFLNRPFLNFILV